MEEDLQNNTEQPDKTGTDSSEIPSTPEAEEPISLSDAITGVFTEPGDTFDAVKKTKKNFWLVPIIILIVLSIIAGFLVMRDQELSSEIKTKQMTAAREQMQEQVNKGNMTQEQMNERMDMMEKGFSGSSPIFMVFLILGPLIGTFFVLFFKGLVFWGAFKILKGTASYMLVISVLGLTSIIESVQVVINTALSILTGRLQANIGLILLFGKDALSENMTKFVSHIDIISIIYFIILGIGLAKVSDVKTSKAMPTVFVIWFIWILISSFVKIPFVGG